MFVTLVFKANGGAAWVDIAFKFIPVLRRHEITPSATEAALTMRMKREERGLGVVDACGVAESKD